MTRIKQHFVKLAAVLLAVASLAAITSPQNVTLAWDPYPDLSPDLSFRLWSSSNVSGPFAVIRTIPGTNTQVTLSVTPGKAFYYLTASNFWGESDPSNVAGTPALPASGVLRIQKGP